MADNPLFSHVMLMLDGSDQSVRCGPCALDICRFTGAKLTIVAIVDTNTLNQLLAARIMVHSEKLEAERELEMTAQKHLKHVTVEAEEHGVAFEPILVKGSVAEAFLDEVRHRKPDLIVMAGFSSAATKRDLHGRERQRVLDETHVPVLLVR